MKIFRFFFSDDEHSEKESAEVRQGVLPDGRGWTDPDSLIRSEGAKRHFEDVDRVWREQKSRRENPAAVR